VLIADADVMVYGIVAACIPQTPNGIVDVIKIKERGFDVDGESWSSPSAPRQMTSQNAVGLMAEGVTTHAQN
jgi:hypothetical protein